MNNLRFANDIVVVDKNLEELTNMMEELEIESRNVDFEQKSRKTKILSNIGEDDLLINKTSEESERR